MRIYLVGPSAEIDAVKTLAAALESRGHSITCRWWDRVAEAQRLGYASDADVPRQFMVESWEANLAGIDACHAVVAMCREAGGFSSGAAFEGGYAHAHRHASLIVGNPKGHALAFSPFCVGVFVEVSSVLAKLGSMEDAVRRLGGFPR